ncbi:flagellin [Bermanella sp. R86510]|uniref:flagellin N-terminal helical domain-containing protein n=1 Tax=unclassified Bermanella TaxID=2627862 RepID=UPI0037C5BAB7
MPQIINTNIASLNAQRNLDKSQSANQTALQRLSSGLRINSAKDDAAGLAISTRFNSQIRGLNVAQRNAGDGISLAQTAEGALGSMNDNLQRIRELAVQSANATNSDVDREALQAEVSQLVSEVSRTADETAFNGRKLLDGSFSATFQIGANAGQTLNVSIAELTADKLGAGAASGLSAAGGDNGLQNGDLIINGVAIDPSTADDDNASFSNKAASAISKVEAINKKSDETGVTAVVNNNTVGGSEMVADAQSGTININGVAVDIQTTTNASTSRASVVEAINAVSDQTGVMATDSGDDANGVTLTAKDGRNVTIDYNGSAITAANSGLAAADTYEGGYTLIADGDVSEIVIEGGDGTGNGNLANAGLSAGTYETGAAQLASTSVANNSGVGFDATSLTAGGLIGLAGNMYTTNMAAAASGTSGLAGYGTTVETITFTAGGNTQTVVSGNTNYGADLFAAAINNLDGVEASAKTVVSLDISGIYAGGVMTTTQTIQIGDTDTVAGNNLGTLSIASGQTIEQVAASINSGFSTIIASYDSTNSTITITDVTGNTLAFSGTAGSTAVGATALSQNATTGPATINFNGSAAYAMGYISDINITDPSVGELNISSSRLAGTVDASTYFSFGSASVAAGLTNSIVASTEDNTFGMEDGDMVINGVSIAGADPGFDKASAVLASDGSNIQTSTKERSAIAMAQAINDVSDETGVRAEVNATTVVGSAGSTFDANVAAAEDIYSAGDTGKLYINGVDLGVISLVDDGSGTIDTQASRQNTIALINKNAGQTGVTAEDNGESITLSAADGRNISVAIDNDNAANGATLPNDTGFGALIGLDSSIDGIGEADIGGPTTSTNVGALGDTAEGAAYETTYGTVTLSSAKAIDLQAGTRGLDELEGLGFTVGEFGGGQDGQFLTDIDISTFEGAQAAITAIDNAISSVASQRADLGAIQNRIESTVSNLAVTSENLSAANSRIADADFAAETAELSRTQVLQQAGISILAQANQAPQQVLSLLG